MKHYTNDESSSSEWRAEILDIDSLDPKGKYLVAPDPSFVGCLPFDTIRHYKSKDETLGNVEYPQPRTGDQ